MAKSISALAITSRRTMHMAQQEAGKPGIDGFRDVNDVHRCHRPHLSKLQKLFRILRIYWLLRMTTHRMTRKWAFIGNDLSLEAQGQQGRRMKSYLMFVEFVNHVKACTEIFPL